MKATREEIESVLSTLDEQFDKNPYALGLHEHLEHACQLYLNARVEDQELLRIQANRLDCKEFSRSTSDGATVR